MSSKEKPIQLEELKQAIGGLLEQRFQTLESKLSELSTSLTNKPEQSEKSGGGAEVPTYKCKGKDCGQVFEDVSDLVLHTVREHPPKPEKTESAEPRVKRHKTAREHLDCPQCRPQFDAEYVKDGWKPPEKEAPKKERRLFDRTET